MAFNDKQIHIINTAEKLFARKGFEGATVRDIADEAEVNLAMISYYFGSKEKLMQALFEQRTSYIIEQVDALLMNKKLSPLEKIYKLVDDYIERIMNRQDFFRIMVHEQVLKKDSPVVSMLNEQKKKNTQLIEKLIREGQVKGNFRKNIDTVLLMNTLVGVGMQSFINKDYYRFYNNLDKTPDAVFNEEFKNRLSNHIKLLIKAYLLHDAQL
jgi:AcrR family transcriptional regulator